MKNLLKTLGLLGTACLMAILVLSCTKEKTPEKKPGYTDIQFNDIKTKVTSMSTLPLTISNSGGVIWKAGDVFIYKTALGNYGKFEVVSVTVTENYKLTIHATTYKSDGTVLSSASALSIRGTWLCDLDATKEVSDDGSEDFKNNRLTNTDTELEPCNGAIFSKYSF